MLISARIAAQLRRHSPQHNFPPVAAENGLIFLEDTEKRSFIGACLTGSPMNGMNENTFAQLKSVVAANYPPETFIQISQLSVPDIDDYAERWLEPKIMACSEGRDMRPEQQEMLREISLLHARHFVSGKDEPHIRATGMRLHRIIQCASIKIPVSCQPTDEEIAKAEAMIEKFQQGLETAGMALERCNAGRYLGLMRLYFNPFQKESNWYDDIRELREQILPPGFVIDYANTAEIKFGDVHARILSPKRFPPRMHISIMDLLQGEPEGINNQVPIPWAISLSIRLPDRTKKKNWFERRFSLLNIQGQGNLSKWASRLNIKKADAEILKEELDQGEAACEMNLAIVLYSKDPKELNRISSQMTTYAAGVQFELVEDTEILWPLFWNTLPLFPSETSIQYLERYWTMSIRQALQAMPCVSEWGGTGKGAALLLETRRAQPFCFDLYDSAYNFNAMLFAQSRAGKTFLTQDIITNYLAGGARAWVVDIGRGYYKLARALGGEFWSFNEESKVCLNPFTNVIDIDDEMDLLVSLMSKMAAPTEGLDDYRRSRMQEAIKAVWSNQGPSMTITSVADYMGLSPDERVRDIAKMLYPFTLHGQFGFWFEGENNLDFKSNLIVLELEELSQKPILQQVVLMILMSKIQHDMFHTMDGIKKLAVFDESWALFDDPEVAQFLNHAFRRFAKYRGSAIVVFQDIGDVYLNPKLVSVAANASTKIILNQLPESVDRAVASGHLTLDPYGVSQLKTVHTVPDAYSEVMFTQGGAWSVARLVLPRFLQVLYSSRGDARDLIIKAVENGIPVHHAINQFIKERG